MRLLPLVASTFAFAVASTSAVASDFSGAHSRTKPLLVAAPGHAAIPTLSQILTANATNGTYLPLENIQGDILVGLGKQKARYVFFHVRHAAQFKSALKNFIPTHITSTATLISHPIRQPHAFVNLAFSSTGLKALGVVGDLRDSYFSAGQFADAESLGDNLDRWSSPFNSTRIHGVFVIGSDQDTHLSRCMDDISVVFKSSITQLLALNGSVRPGNQTGHEHFGFLDGISQPAVLGFVTKPLPGQEIVPPGTILTGRAGDRTVRPPWAIDGSFMAFRHFEQKVPEFHAWTRANAIRRTSAGNLSQEQGAELLGARMFGRWKSGAPLDLAPTHDDPELGADPQRNNDFSYADTLLDQARCPFSAHARKTNPRADVTLDRSILNHAIRASIPYGPETSPSELASGVSAQDRGLLFAEYQSDIGNGFRSQQIKWANDPKFPPRKPDVPGVEPIVGQGSPRLVGGLDPLDQSKMYDIPQFVIPKGGEYFFMPSIPALASVIAS